MVASALRSIAMIAALAMVTPVLAQEPDYVLISRYETSGETLGERGGSSSSSGSTALAVRFIAQRADGVEFEYTMPGDPDEVGGPARWMFPARVLIAPDGTKTLLNAQAMEVRVDAWLDEANWTREVCER